MKADFDLWDSAVGWLRTTHLEGSSDFKISMHMGRRSFQFSSSTEQCTSGCTGKQLCQPVHAAFDAIPTCVLCPEWIYESWVGCQS